jgi:hypothetical protein
MTNKSEKGRLFWMQVWLATLSVFIVAQFVVISNLENKNLEKKIDKLNTQYSNNFNLIKNELEITKDTLNAIFITQTKNDSTLIKQIGIFQKQTKDLETTIKRLEEKVNTSIGKSANFKTLLLWILVSVVISIFVSLLICWVFISKRSKHYKGDGQKELSGEGLVANDSQKKGNNSDGDQNEKNKKNIEGNQEVKPTEISEVINEENVVDTIEPTEQNVQFYRMPENNTFIEEAVNQTDAYFRIFEIEGDKAKYEYCGSAVNADLLREICKFKNSPSSGDIIETVKPGIVKKDNDRWCIYSDNLAEIEFKP